MQPSLPNNTEPAKTATSQPGFPTSPYVGLRPFNSDEALLFFGREQQTIELLQQLHRTHFVGIVGSSGCGKSSLVRAGLIPKLKAGFLVEERDQWLIATLKPGDAPLEHLAEALEQACGTGSVSDLRRSIGTIDPAGEPVALAPPSESAATAQVAHAPRTALSAASSSDVADDVEALLEQLAPALDATEANLLLLVDQFEELFRFGLETGKTENRAAATRFVNLLLALTEQRRLPIYVVLTMRSDFLGDCDNFFGLPEALNRSQYLVPRLTREQLRQAVEGPLHLFGASMSPALLERILTDVGDQSDQLPVLQHALMRTWEHAHAHHDAHVEVADYEAVGTLKEALTRDAEAALVGLDEAQLKLTGRLFGALTATDDGNRKIRRPQHLSELCAVTGAPENEVRDIIERLRADNRSFLVLNSEADPLVDISHESLIRQWPRMDEWIRLEQEAADVFNRLVVAARRKRELWRGGDLAEARKWLREQQPNTAWAYNYDDDAGALEIALRFLARSKRRRHLVQITGCIAILFIFALGMWLVNWKITQTKLLTQERAEKELLKAEANYRKQTEALELEQRNTVKAKMRELEEARYQTELFEKRLRKQTIESEARLLELQKQLKDLKNKN